MSESSVSSVSGGAFSSESNKTANSRGKRGGKEGVVGRAERERAGVERGGETGAMREVMPTANETDEYRELARLEIALDQELTELKEEETGVQSTKETIDLLHRYNYIKDGAESILAALAVIRSSTVAELYSRYGLSPEDQD